MIIIQADYKKIEGSVYCPTIFDSACAMYGAMDSGVNFQLSTFEDLLNGSLDKQILSSYNCFIGSVEFMQEVWKRMNVNPDVPMNTITEGWRITMGEAREMVKSGNSIFVKPVIPKAYNLSGTLLSPLWPNSNAGVPDDAELLAYIPFHKPIVSEWRCYVYENKIEYVANYSGDIFQTPDWENVKSIVSNNSKTFPVAYTIDVAVLSDGPLDDSETVVVEFNDFWAIGNYGIDNITYLRMLRARYREIVTKNLCWDVTKK
jgi:hypothetical protein